MYLWQVPKLLLHRLFPNVRYSIWIDGKLQLVVDPYQILERYIWFYCLLCLCMPVGIPCAWRDSTIKFLQWLIIGDKGKAVFNNG